MKIVRILGTLIMVMMLVHAACADSLVNISWSGVTGATYNIYRDQDCVGNFTLFTITSDIQYRYIQPNGTYCYYVTSVELGTESVPSDIITLWVP